MCCIHGENRQRTGSTCLHRTYVLSTVQTSILTLTPLLPLLLPHTPREVSTEISVVRQGVMYYVLFSLVLD